MSDEDLELASRRTLFQRIADSPGTHFRALLADSEYAKGTVQYHLRWLADEDLVEVAEDGQYTRYYPAAEFDETDKDLLNALRRTHSRRILAHLLEHGPLSTTELSDRLEKAKSTVSWHLSELEDAGLISKERAGRSVVYEVEASDRLRNLYTVYRGSFTDRVVDRILGIWDSY